MTEEEKEYNAILIDTTIFDQNGLRLEKGMLRKLRQFKKSPIVFLFPDVIAQEVLSHLYDKIKIARNTLEKSLNDAGDHLFFAGSALTEAKKQLLNREKFDLLAKSRLDQFVSETGAEVLECGSFVSVSVLLEQYFSSTPPFAATGKKKCEFPDAIILLAAEGWSSQNDKNILAISKDKDWEEYCKDSERIDFHKDLAVGLEIFNKTNAPYTLLANLEKALDENRAESFLAKIQGYLMSRIDALTPSQEAESFLSWEPDGCYTSFGDFEFQGHDFRIIEVDKDYAVLEGSALITVEAEGTFSFSVFDSIDKDDVNLGSTSAVTEETFETKILITIIGDLSGGLDELDIEDVEIVTPITTIDFGSIDPYDDQFE